MQVRVFTERLTVPSANPNVSIGESFLRIARMVAGHNEPQVGDKVIRRVSVELQTTKRAPLGDLAKKMIATAIVLAAFVLSIIALRATDVPDTKPTAVLFEEAR